MRSSEQVGRAMGATPARCFLRCALADRHARGHLKGTSGWITAPCETRRLLPRIYRMPGLSVWTEGRPSAYWACHQNTVGGAVLCGSRGDMSMMSRVTVTPSGADTPERGPLLLWM